MIQSHWRAKYRSRSPGQGTCQVITSRRSTTQGLVVVGLMIDKIWNVDLNCVKVTTALNIGQGHGQGTYQVSRQGDVSWFDGFLVL